MKLRIRDLREDHDIKQQQIADYLMCDQSLYSKYERNERELPLEYAAKLADYYGVSLDYLVGRDYSNEFGYLNEQEKAIITAYRKMNNDNKIRYFAEAQGILIAQD